MDHAEATDEQLVAEYNAGEARALETLAQRHYQSVCRSALYRTRDPEVARDIAQEVFLRVTRALPRFRGEAQFKPWLHCITARVYIDNVRAARGASPHDGARRARLTKRDDRRRRNCP